MTIFDTLLKIILDNIIIIILLGILIWQLPYLIPHILNWYDKVREAIQRGKKKKEKN